MKDTLEFTDTQLNTIWRILAAIINIGELSVSDEDDGETKIDDNELVTKSEFDVNKKTKIITAMRNALFMFLVQSINKLNKF